jgi:hypothetical protein
MGSLLFGAWADEASAVSQAKPLGLIYWRKPMATNAELAAKLLRNAGEFFRNIGSNTPQIQEQMEQNARTYDIVADWLEEDPTGEAPIASEPEVD